MVPTISHVLESVRFQFTCCIYGQDVRSLPRQESQRKRKSIPKDGDSSG